MTRTQTISIALLAALITAAGVWWFLNNFELVEEEIRTDYSAKARHNPFLAAQRFLQRLGHEVDSTRQRDNFNELLRQNNVLITTYSHLFETADRRNAISQWIEQGGHLVLEVKMRTITGDVDAQTPFLDQFGISPGSKNFLFEDYQEETVKAQIYQDGAQFEVSFLPRYTVDVDSDNVHLRVSDDNGSHLAEISVGDGLLTVFSDLDFWRNDRIGELDHAALLAEVLGEDPGRIWILHYTAMPTLAEILWQKAKTVIVPLVTLLLFSLWALNNRFGPFILQSKQQRRSLIEHINAAGQFDWRFSYGANLLNSVRSELFQYLESRYPAWQFKSENEKLTIIAEKTKLAEPQISHALSGECSNHAAFLNAVGTLQTIRNIL